MKKLSLFLLLILAGCKEEVKRNDFGSDLQQLQTYFHIPGIAAIVTKGDSTLFEFYNGADSSTVFPMASLTKMFTGQLILRKPEILDNELEGYIKVRQVLSHTSQGDTGKHFYYSNRFRLLQAAIEESYETSFDKLVYDSIVSKYHLTNTFLLKDSTSLAGRNFASPYVYEGETKPGFIDYGFSSSAGITSTVRDIAKFGKLITRVPKEKYNYGYFSQDVEGERILWAYGQYDCYSSLFIKVPSKDLTLVIAANNSLMSDPARLIYGDVTTSLFALSFFKNYLHIDVNESKARALSESFFAMYDSSRVEKSEELLRSFVSSVDADLSVLHNLIIVKEGARSTEFDNDIKRIGENLLKEDVNDPYANYYLANFYQLNNNIDSATIYYRKIAELKNFSRNWYTKEAEQWLKQSVSSTAGTASPH